MITNGLYLFTRDLRIEDNIGLRNLSKDCDKIYTAFIFTPEQIKNNSYKSYNAINFMIESLRDLQYSITEQGGNLCILYGDYTKCVYQLCDALNINIISIADDVTPYATKRLNDLKEKINCNIITTQEHYLTNPGSIKTTTGKPYVKFTPYYDKFMHCINSGEIQLLTPNRRKPTNFSKLTANQKSRIPNLSTIDHIWNTYIKNNGSENRLVKGGRSNALKMIRKAISSVTDYEATRNTLSDETTLLSAYIKFGCISVREAYELFSEKMPIKSRNSLVRQLIWRDFYAQVMKCDPDVLYGAMKRGLRDIDWRSTQKGSSGAKDLNAWQRGLTGFPIVDAGMRQLEQTGYMHNRARLITASFLPKTLLIDWREGEKHFAKSLTDYDPASNNGNWQWVAGTGSDSQPYFRILNPYRQSARYDPNAEYIKKWIPELKDIPARDIHNWDTAHVDYIDIAYPSPIVDYTNQKELALEMYKKALKD